MTLQKNTSIKVTHKNDGYGAGEYITVELSNGTIINIWDKCLDNEKFGVIEISKNIAELENGECPTQILLDGNY